MTTAAGRLADDYARLRAGGGGAVVRGECALVWVEGPDAAAFLQGVLTADVAGLAPGACAYALLLDGKGRIRFDMTCRRDAEDAFTLVADPAAGPGLVGALEHYHVSEDLDVLGPETSALLVLGGLPAPGDGALVDAVLPGRVPGTTLLVVSDPDAAVAALGVPEAGAAALEALRVEAGVPRVGVDTGPHTLVREAGVEDAAVSFTKGCYLGQETVARVAHRGHVNRRLCVLAADAPIPVGAAVRSAGAEVGRVTSASPSPRYGHAALATVRTEVPSGAEVEVDGLPVPARLVTG
ncbi:MAG: glycine cleavage T C-terminal barrel domain-containing protein [Actinomycetota bacterium]